jgi:hypothetical protein
LPVVDFNMRWALNGSMYMQESFTVDPKHLQLIETLINEKTIFFSSNE